MQKIHKDDEVIVITGKNKGTVGKILQVIKGTHVIIDGVAVVKKAVKPNPNKEIIGGIIAQNMPIDISNVAIFNSETKKADRVGIKFENEKKIRFYKSTGKIIEGEIIHG